MTEERRRSVRVKKALEIVYSSASPPISARADDISESGMFIETSHPLEPGAPVDFSLILPDENVATPVRGKGTVTWCDRAVGVGVRFTELSGEDRDRIKWYVAAVFFA